MVANVTDLDVKNEEEAVARDLVDCKETVMELVREGKFFSRGFHRPKDKRQDKTARGMQNKTGNGILLDGMSAGEAVKLSDRLPPGWEFHVTLSNGEVSAAAFRDDPQDENYKTSGIPRAVMDLGNAIGLSEKELKACETSEVPPEVLEMARALGFSQSLL